MSFKTTLPEIELLGLIEGDLKERVTKLLKGKHQVKAISLVKKEKGVSVVDAIYAVNRFYEKVNPRFATTNGRRC